MIRVGKPRYYRYILEPRFIGERMKQGMKEEIDMWYYDNIIVDSVFDFIMMESGFPNKPRFMLKNHTWELLGVPQDILEDLPFEDKRELNEIIASIKRDMERLLEFKLRLIGVSSEEDLKKKHIELLKEINSEKERDEFNLFNIGILWLTTPFDLEYILRHGLSRGKPSNPQLS